LNTTTQLAADAMRSGSPAARVAHGLLFERVLERVHRYFRRVIYDSHEAEECLSRTVVLLEESLRTGKYDPGRSFNAWMWLKAHTVYAQWCRERGKRPGQLEGDEGASGPAIGRGGRESGVALREKELDAETVLRHVREKLGPEAYECFVLYYEGGLTQEEVSKAMERDRKTVRKRLAEAHELIDELLGQTGQ
jgi:RNA polymerase sigma factor (sigma-70 family)